MASEPEWITLAREMRSECPRRSWREISRALDVPEQILKARVNGSLRRDTPRGPGRKNSRKLTIDALKVAQRAFKLGDRHRSCRNPDCPRPFSNLRAHHVVYRQHVRDEGGNEWDPWNALNVCQSCHTMHHSRERPLPLSILRQNNIEFAVILLGARQAYSYFRRYYAGEDARVERIVEGLA